MTSTEESEPLLKVKEISVHFELEHYQNHGLRDLFIHAITHPLSYVLRGPELLKILDGISFELKKGMRVGILGLNGSG